MHGSPKDPKRTITKGPKKVPKRVEVSAYWKTRSARQVFGCRGLVAGAVYHVKIEDATPLRLESYGHSEKRKRKNIRAPKAPAEVNPDASGY